MFLLLVLSNVHFNFSDRNMKFNFEIYHFLTKLINVFFSENGIDENELHIRYNIYSHIKSDSKWK